MKTLCCALAALALSGFVLAGVMAGVGLATDPNTATATDPGNNTSEFSACVVVVPDTTMPSVTINQAAAQSYPTSTSPILFDVVLGFGSHDNPAGGLAPALAEARREARAHGRSLAMIGHVCGTDGDPQAMARVTGNYRRRNERDRPPT